jgi:competence protein ComGF
MKTPIKKKQLFATHLNSRGFTMIEVLLSFSIYCILTAFLPLVFSIILNMTHITNRTQRLEFELFIGQLNTELQGCDYIDVRNGKLYMQSAGEEITFEKYGTSIRRLVHFSGHEVILQNIKSVEFNKSQTSIHIKVVDQDDFVYEDQLSPFIQVVGEG